METDTFNFMEEAQKGFENLSNGTAPEPEELADDFDNIPEGEKERIRENRQGGGFEYNENQGREQESGRSEEMIEAEARMITGMVNMLNKSICSIISGRPRDQYDIGKSEMQDYQTVTKEYLKTVQKPAMSPGQMFFVTTLTLTGANVWTALEDRKKKQREDREADARKRANEAETPKEREKAKEDLESIVKEDVVKDPLRNQFQVDGNGFYKYDVAGNYLKGKKKTEKAPPEVLKIIEECKAKSMSDGDTNSKIRFILYGSSNPV